MTLEQLRIFVGVAEREHMTAAARALNVTQSAASAAIAALEERHAIKLFHRIGRGIMLTEAGRLFLTEARGVLARAAAAETVLEELGGLKRGTLRVVASQTIATYWLPPFLAAFQERYPRLCVELRISNTEQAAARVHNGEADFGIVEGETDDPAVAHWTIGEDRLILVQSGPFATGRINAAWLTGGSSLIPAIRAQFERRFGAERIATGGELTSIANGLALIGHEPNPMEWSVS